MTEHALPRDSWVRQTRIAFIACENLGPLGQRLAELWFPNCDAKYFRWDRTHADATAQREAIIEELRAFTPEVLISFYSDFILPADLVRGPDAALNIHPADWPGMGYDLAELLAGETEKGVRLHLLTENIDDGRIILRKSGSILPDTTHAALRRMTQALSLEVLGWLCQRMWRLESLGAFRTFLGNAREVAEWDADAPYKFTFRSRNAKLAELAEDDPTNPAGIVEDGHPKDLRVIPSHVLLPPGVDVSRLSLDA